AGLGLTSSGLHLWDAFLQNQLKNSIQNCQAGCFYGALSSVIRVQEYRRA
ncbi:MAG: hypothetical protein ACI8RZ_003148, partial [Myxococcota bacterium]